VNCRGSITGVGECKSVRMRHSRNKNENPAIQLGAFLPQLDENNVFPPMFARARLFRSSSVLCR
jgi:hypothetical protein